MNKIAQIIVIVFYFMPLHSYAQNVIIPPSKELNINLEFREELLISLDSLANQMISNHINKSLLWEKEGQFTKVILEELFSVKPPKEDTINTISYQLLNSYKIEEGRHLCQLAFYSHKTGHHKSLETIINIIAHTDGMIKFSTPLNYLTKSWKAEEVGQIKYLFRDSIRIDRAQKFAHKNVLIANRFKKLPQTFTFYMVENYQEILKLLGFDYNSRSIGRLRDGCGVIADKVIFSVMNNEDFSHDIFHYYSGTYHQDKSRNWVTEEGIAYSWGNAYYIRNDGEMADQKELIAILKNHILQNPATDLLELLEKNFWTDKTGIYNHLAPDFQVGRLISSVICDEVLRKHGMDGINQLITCGTKPNQFDPYFRATEDLLGINRSNFSESVKGLLKLHY